LSGPARAGIILPASEPVGFTYGYSRCPLRGTANYYKYPTLYGFLLYVRRPELCQQGSRTPLPVAAAFSNSGNPSDTSVMTVPIGLNKMRSSGLRRTGIRSSTTDPMLTTRKALRPCRFSRSNGRPSLLTQVEIINDDAVGLQKNVQFGVEKGYSEIRRSRPYP